jgi:Glycosyl hydrolase family 26
VTPRRVLPIVVLCAGAVGLSAGSTGPGAQGAAGRVRAPGIALGVLGDATRFRAQTGQASTIRHTIISWNQGLTWGTRLPALLDGMRPTPLLGIGTSDWRSKAEVVSPKDIAQGRGDAFLVGLNGAIAQFGSLVYLRPLPEMNNYHRPFSAFDANGRSRGPTHATSVFRKAFARIAVVVRGGTAASMNAKLRRLGLPPIANDLPSAPVRIVWNPQGYGSPDLPQNSAQAYYPGDAYVDVVANDLYDQGFNAAWDANERLYAAHPGKRFAIGEWGLWSIDDPAFVGRMATFAKTHGRVEFVAYFSGPAGSPWDLAAKPASRAAYRKLVTPLGR